MEEWKVAKDISWVKHVGLSSIHIWDVCHEWIVREFVCNWDEKTFNSKVWGQEFTLF